MKIKLMDYATRTAFIVAIGDNLDTVSKIISLSDPDDKDNFDVIFSVNGVELDFQIFIDLLAESYEKSVSAAAKKMIEARFDNITCILDDTFEELTEKITDVKSVVSNMVKSLRHEVDEI